MSGSGDSHHSAVNELLKKATHSLSSMTGGQTKQPRYVHIHGSDTSSNIAVCFIWLEACFIDVHWSLHKPVT